jgi:hypothetical protein
MSRVGGLTALVFLLAVALAHPLDAQTRRPAAAPPPQPAVSFRPFVLAAGQRPSAQTTFEAAFNESVQPFLGGGLQVAWRGGFFVEFGASRFKQTGERAFIDGGEVFRLGIPLTATITPLELAAGYRFGGPRSRLLPYGGGGIGSYGYKESSDFSDPEEDVEVRHVGYLAVGGVEVRLHRWIGVTADAQYTHVPGILGSAGLSQNAGEDDLGGIAVRFRLIIGR